jgi:hypothetical protein
VGEVVSGDRRRSVMRPLTELHAGNGFVVVVAMVVILIPPPPVGDSIVVIGGDLERSETT